MVEEVGGGGWSRKRFFLPRISPPFRNHISAKIIVSRRDAVRAKAVILNLLGFCCCCLKKIVCVCVCVVIVVCLLLAVVVPSDQSFNMQGKQKFLVVSM